MLKPASIRHLAMAVGVCASAGAGQAEESLVSYKSLSPAIALEAAQAALLDCQRRGYQVTVAIVDRSGVVQVLLRDRYAGPHTPATASGKAWTAATFRSSTSNLVAISQPGMRRASPESLRGRATFGSRAGAAGGRSRSEGAVVRAE
jgi:uncharacterized protein GlcG (DUF336 family)